jgi:hypothetical protein
MNVPQMMPPRLHWSPVEPSWIVSTCLIVLAVLPHKIPPVGRHVLEHPIGSLVFASLSAFVAWHIPVLGAAMFIFLAGILLHRRSFKKEGFAASNLNNEKVQKKERQRWHDELVMMEEPEAVQVKTGDPVLQYDKVTDEESAPWFGEGILNERPQGIQDKPVGEVPEYDEGGASYGRH